jgi:uncharacterized membrane protein YbhN (UPF0104 family)
VKQQASVNRRRILVGVKLVVLLVVGYFLVKAVRDAQDELSRHDFSIFSVRPVWLLASAIFYLIGMLPMGIYWHRLLVSMGQRPRLADTLRAFYAGHLGKYVPGKAMVVLIRAGMLRGERVNATVTAVSVFAETLTMMAVGAFLAATTIAWQFAEERMFFLLAIGLLLVSGIPTWPPVFRCLVRTFDISASRIAEFTRRGPPDRSPGQDLTQVPDSARSSLKLAEAGYSWSVVLNGWIADLVGWLILGLSLLAVLNGIVQPVSFGGSAERYLAALASVTLATVVGFLSLLPAGVLVRELVIQGLLSPQLGPGMAMVSAIVFRLVSLVAELVCAALLHLSRARFKTRV